MRIYQVSFDGDSDGHKGYDYVATKRDAMEKKREWDEQDGTAGGVNQHEAVITPIDVDCSKAGILQALNRYASHNDNG